MTVCVAALADKSTIVGVSDRMLTAGDIEFEPAQSKIWQFSAASFAMISGDSAIQTAILTKVDRAVRDRIAQNVKSWVPIKDVANLYCKYYREVLREQAERAILHPLGLDIASFLTAQATMQSDLVMSIAEKLTAFDFDSPLETLFMGKDNDGPVDLVTGEPLIYTHLYATDKDKLSCLTSVGFAAIGIGKFHAESQLMSAGHWPAKPLHESLLLAYAAKKRAEVAPGVGKDTDVIIIGPGLGANFKATDKHVAGLDKIYQETRRVSVRAVKRALTKTYNFVDQIAKQLKEEGRRRGQQTMTATPTAK